jgi:Fur family zinc uptake transcriptional regulator
MSKRGDEMRADVLAVLRSAGRAMSAYDVLEELRSAYPKIAPPTVYNALTSLTHKGRVLRVESLKAYIACQCDGENNHSSVLSICDECGTVEERVAPNILKNLSCFVEETGFAPQRHVIEVHGVCSACGSETEGT